MSPILIPVMALLIPIVVVPTSLLFRHRLRVREMEHDERIRAMELGIGMAPRKTEISWPGAAVCIGIGAGVPIGSMLVAWLAVLTNNNLSGEVFGIPMLISFAAIWTAKSLANRMMGLPDDDESATAPDRVQAARETAKPKFDPDAYDVVGSRG